MWSYMMKHVLVAKKLWNIVAYIEKRPNSPTAQPVFIDPTASPSRTPTTMTTASPPTHDQLRWDGKDAQAHALIALSIK